MMSLEQIHATRAEQRKQRLIEAERELAAEEAEALQMTEEQRRILMQPFSTVKAEFADLDGLRWTQAALHKLQPPQRRTTNHVAPSPTPKTYVVLTNADLATFSSEDTIRIPSTSTQSRPSLPSVLPSVSKSPPDPALRHRDGSRSRSPIKGLFPSRPESAESTNKAPSSLRFSVPSINDAPSSNMPRSPTFSRQISPIETPAPPGLSQMPGPPSYNSDPSPRPHHHGRRLTRQKTMGDLGPLFQQGSSPPSLLSPPASISNTGTPHKSARARLHDLLHDDSRLSSPSSSSYTTLDPIPPPTFSLRLPSIDTSSDSSYDDDETPTPSPVLDYPSTSDTAPWIKS